MWKKIGTIAAIVGISLVAGWYIHEFEERLDDRQPHGKGGRFLQPESCALDARGRLYELDADLGYIQVLGPDNRFLFSFGGHRDSVVPGLFYSAEELTVQPDGTVVVLDDKRLQTFDRNGHFAGVPVQRADSPIDHPETISSDADGNVYVTNEDRREILRFTPDFSDYDLYSVPHEPEGITAGPDGRIWVTFSKEDYVGVYSPDGKRQKRIGSTGSGRGEFDIPDAVAISPSYEVYVLDQNNNRVQVFDRNGTFLRMFGSHGAGRVEFKEPEDLRIGPEGRLYVADSDNGRIQVLKPDGTFVREID